MARQAEPPSYSSSPIDFKLVLRSTKGSFKAKGCTFVLFKIIIQKISAMKKQWFFLPALLLSTGLFLPSCTEEKAKTENMQQPSGTEEAVSPATATTVDQTLVLENLTEAFKGETTATAKYAAFAEKAQDEGYPKIALLFKAASKSESFHANNHKAVLEEMGASIPDVKPEFTVKSTLENLNDALSGETYEVNTMYPGFLTNAKAADAQMALITLNYAYKTEQKHMGLYKKAIAALESDRVSTLPDQYYICPTCGKHV
ncbi:MAG: rubrerythrin [Saprospirales bacterium]|nr:rubrerythrin [Saprospirales bacterium]